MTGGGEQAGLSWLVACHLSALPGLMSCKSRAEAFARHLQNKLKFLSGHNEDDNNADKDDNGGVCTNSASSLEIAKLTVTSSNHENDSNSLQDEEELYYDFDIASSCGSPQSPEHRDSNAASDCSQEMKGSSNGQLNDTSGQNNSTHLLLKERNKTEVERESAYNSAGEQESSVTEGNVTVLEQGQINLSKKAEVELEEYKDYDTSSALQIKLEQNENEKNEKNLLRENVEGEDENGENDENDENDENEDVTTNKFWGVLKQIDRFQVRKINKDENETEESEENNETEDAIQEEVEEEEEEDLHVNCDQSENEIENTRPKHIYRSSSLKTGKTPPGTPGQKKIVRFADVLGLDLEAVRHVFLDDLPHVPQSAYSDLNATAMETEIPATIEHEPGKTLVPMFTQPCTTGNFVERLRSQKVCLENASLSDGAIRGQVRVLNLHFEKKVYIRFSMNEWRTAIEIEANYVPGSNDGFSDKFSFCIFGGDQVQIGERFLFCVRYLTIGREFWDNNHGYNYYFQCIQDSLIQSHRDNTLTTFENWVPFL